MSRVSGNLGLCVCRSFWYSWAVGDLRIRVLGFRVRGLNRVLGFRSLEYRARVFGFTLWGCRVCWIRVHFCHGSWALHCSESDLGFRAS